MRRHRRCTIICSLHSYNSNCVENISSNFSSAGGCPFGDIPRRLCETKPNFLDGILKRRIGKTDKKHSAEKGE